MNSETGFLGLGAGYSAVIDEIAPVAGSTQRDRAASVPMISPAVDFPQRETTERETADAEQPLPPQQAPVRAVSPTGLFDFTAAATAPVSDEGGAVRRRTSYIDPSGDREVTAVDGREFPGSERSERERRGVRRSAKNSVSRARAEARGVVGASAPAEARGLNAFGLSARPERARVSKRSIAKRAFAGTAMVFALGIGVATTVPANAYFALSGRSAAEAAASSSASVQQVTAGAGNVGDVVRDGYDSFAPTMTSAAGIKTGFVYSTNTNSPIQWPFPVPVPISDGFGPRVSPGGIGSTNHMGVDFAPGGGTPIGAIADGVVNIVNSSDNGGLGVYVTVEHVINGEHITSVYGHMRVGSIQVQQGQAIKVGQTIGLVGSTGTSTGNHLHLEVHVEGTPVDPFAWLQQHVKPL